MSVKKEKPQTSGNFGDKMVMLIQKREISLSIILVIFAVALTVATPTFFRVDNFRVLLQGMSSDMMIAVPMCISLIAGHTDFSVGSAMCLNSAICGLLLINGVPTPLAILIALCTGFILGGLNGVIINKLGLTPLVATMGTWMAYRGIALVMLGGSTISSFPESFLVLGRASFFGIPCTIVYMIITIAVGSYLLKYNNFFHNAYYIGSNQESAKLAGINVEKFNIISYGITGVVSAFSGMVLAARLGSVSQNAGESLEFRNVVALLIGGISMDGGVGSILGAFLGVFFQQLVSNAITLLYLNASYTKVINGIILIFAVGLDTVLKKKKAKA